MIQQSRPAEWLPCAHPPSRQDEDEWYRHATPRTPDGEIFHWLQQSSVERPSHRRTLLEQLLGIHPGNQFATESHYHGPRLQYKEQSNYSTAQGLAYRQLIPHTRMYEYTSLRAPILGLGRRLMCRINNRYPTSLLFGPVGKPPWHYHPHVATPLSQWHFESSRSPKERRLNKECKQYHLVIQPCHIMCYLDPAISD